MMHLLWKPSWWNHIHTGNWQKRCGSSTTGCPDAEILLKIHLVFYHSASDVCWEPWLRETGTNKNRLCCPWEKWNESGFRPPLCTYRLNWARRTSWGWWDDWDDTVLQTQDSKFEPWRSEAEHATSRSRRLPTILTFTRGWGRNIFVSFKPPRPGTELWRERQRC